MSERSEATRPTETTESGIALPASATDRDGGGSGDGGDDAGIGSRVLSASPLIWVLLLAAVGWAVYSTLTSRSSSVPTARAVVIPTDERSRTVVALPCAALGAGGSGGAGTSLPGAITTVLPQGADERVVAVTGCSTGSSSTAKLTGDSARTALVVMPPGLAVTALQEATGKSTSPLPGMKVGSVTRVPPDADAETIVIPPCPTRRSGGGGSATPAPDAFQGSGGVLLVPCPAQSN